MMMIINGNDFAKEIEKMNKKIGAKSEEARQQHERKCCKRKEQNFPFVVVLLLWSLWL